MSEQGGFIEIDTEQHLAAIIKKLETLPDKIAAPNILKNALNATARKVRRQMVKDASGQYAIKNKSILKQTDQGAPEVQTASVSELFATIKSKGPMQDIMSFMTKPNTATGAAAAQVLKNGAMKPLEVEGLKAFVTSFASGHTAIVQRRGSERLPLKKLLSPAVPHMLGNENVQAEAERLTFEVLQVEIQKRIDKATEK